MNANLLIILHELEHFTQKHSDLLKKSYFTIQVLLVVHDKDSALFSLKPGRNWFREGYLLGSYCVIPSYFIFNR